MPTSVQPIDLGIPQVPQLQNQELYREFLTVYNALRKLAASLEAIDVEGVKGDKGDKGDPGDSDVSNMGNPAVLGFLVAEGEIGEQGVPGQKGQQGEKGERGFVGQDGQDGLDGVDGFSIKGDRGDRGLDGSSGLDGMHGSDGEDGIDGFSIQGPAGKDGKKGKPGQDGRDGEDGFDGISVKGDQGIQGQTGSFGLDGKDGEDGLDGFTIKGDKGDRGLAGLPAMDGLDGEDGRDGFNGQQGFPGIKGDTGIPGADGVEAETVEIIYLPSVSGPQGPQGLQGIFGLDGIDGEDIFSNLLGINNSNFANISPAGNFTLTQNGVNVLTAEYASAVVDTLYLKAGKVGIGQSPAGASQLLQVRKDQNAQTLMLISNITNGTAAQCTVQLVSDGNSQLQFSNYSLGNTVAKWGVTMAGYSEVLGGILGNGMVVGTFGATQLILGTNVTAALTISATQNLTVAAGKNMVFSGNAAFLRLPQMTVANLTAAATAGAGSVAFVTDAVATAITGLGLAVVGGGANKVLVYSDGTNWIIL